MPLEEGGRNSLLHRGVYIPGDFIWGGGGGVICHINLVGPDNGRVVATKGVGLGPHEVVVVG